MVYVRLPLVLPLLGFVLACGTPGEQTETNSLTIDPLPTTGPPDPSETSGLESSSGTTTTGETTGANETSADTTGTAGSTGEPPKFDIGALPDFDKPECLQCGIVLDSQMSGELDVFGANVFATAQLEMRDVYALGTHGAGRFIAMADSALPFQELGDCPLIEWLSGGELDPDVLWFGWTPSDGPVGWNLPTAVQAGIHMPAMYIGNPAQLAADFDLVMYLEASGQFDGGDEPSNAEMQTLLDYVEVHGGGLYVVSEFANAGGTAYMTPNDLDSVNRVMVPMGVESLQVQYPWGEADGEIDFECFPPPAG